MKTLLTCAAVVVVLFTGMAAQMRISSPGLRTEESDNTIHPPPIQNPESRIQNSPGPDDCLVCHDDDSFTMERGGKEVSLYVDPDAYAASPHGELDCVDCHEGFDPDEEPHREDIRPVDCAGCHREEVRQFRTGGHRGDLTCQSCHAQSYHAPAPKPQAPEAACAACHADATDALAHSVHGGSEAGAGCFDCHTPHAAEAADADRCLTCHGEADFVRRNVAQQGDTALVDAFRHSVHAEDVACSDCHGGHLILPAASDSSAVARARVAETCAGCHAGAAEVYRTSEHGRALEAGVASAPTCTDCHGEHGILAPTDAASPMSRSREVDACLACHADTPDVRERMTHSSAFVTSYRESVHGRKAAAGDPDAAVCSDCHGGHQAMKASDPASKVNRFNLAETCGTCHEATETAFMASTHGRALAAGVADAPTCTTCHGEHGIVEHGDAASPVAAVNVSEQVCSPCHDSYKLSEKYGFPSDRTASFGDSYHGLANRFGDTEAANCASCHGVHDILPSSDPASKVHQANLAATCGTCHPGANVNFTRGQVHVVRTPEGDRLLYWIATVYGFLIAVIIGGMFVHNLLDWLRKLVEQHHRRRRAQPPVPYEPRTRLFVRMTGNERLQHAALASSFILLVVTGFMLKFPDAWWVAALKSVSGDWLFGLRSLLHRVAGAVMIAASFYHLYYVLFTERGRRFVRDVWVSWQDAKDLWQMLRFNVGAAKARPRFGRFNYVEKAEYWSLIWGTIVMCATGLVLWFENTFMGMTSKLFIDVAETIHYFEAWLAFLAIVVWHFYYVIFNPDVYPVNLTFLTGEVTEEEMEKEHPLELEAIKKAEAEAAAV